MQTEKNIFSKIPALLLPLYFLILYILPTSRLLLWIPDESRYAEISREMLASGNWVVPHLIGLRYFEKPVAGYWVNNICQMLFGDSNFAVRAGQVLCTGLAALLVYYFARKIWKSREKAFCAALIYMSSILVFIVGTISVLDSILTFWLTAAMMAFYLAAKAEGGHKKVAGYALLGLFCGMAFMTKGFLALALPVIIAVPFMIWRKRFLELIKYGPVAIVAAALISAPWVIAVWRLEPDYWHYFFWVEHVQRFAGEEAQHPQPIWFYIPFFVFGTIPWFGFLPASLCRGWAERKHAPEYFFLLLWALIPLIFFSLSKGKLVTYILPCFAPLALLMADTAVNLAEKGEAALLQLPRRLRFSPFRLNAGFNIFLGSGGVLAALAVSLNLLPLEPRLFAPEEAYKWLLGLAAPAAFAAVGFICLKDSGKSARRWLLAALACLPAAALYPTIMPESVINLKMPQQIINENYELFKNAPILLGNDVSIATSLAWELKRDDIILYSDKGEVSYGLEYPDSAGKFVPRGRFNAWLENARKRGDVALLLRLSDDMRQIKRLPTPDKIIIDHHLGVVVYKKLEE